MPAPSVRRLLRLDTCASHASSHNAVVVGARWGFDSYSPSTLSSSSSASRLAVHARVDEASRDREEHQQKGEEDGEDADDRERVL